MHVNDEFKSRKLTFPVLSLGLCMHKNKVKRLCDRSTSSGKKQERKWRDRTAVVIL